MTNIWRRLPIRIAMAIIIIGPTLLIAALIFTAFYARFMGSSRSIILLLELPVIGLGVPLILGLLVAKFVSIPLKRLTEAISSLKESNYTVTLEKEGIAEFDQVVDGFNQLVARLRQEEELRKDLISDTSHELRTPVAALYAQLQGLKDGILALDTDRISLLLGQIERLTDLIDRLQQYASIRSAAAKPKMKMVDLSELVNSLSILFTQELLEANMTIISQVEPGATVQADIHFLEQILSNVIDNAIHYSGGKTITITFDGRLLTLSDDGQGVSDADAARLFERFYRVDQSRNRATGGLGLGLAIVKELVEAMNWSITASQAQPGLKITIATNS